MKEVRDLSIVAGELRDEPYVFKGALKARPYKTQMLYAPSLRLLYFTFN
jgi:hypothetical protein